MFQSRLSPLQNLQFYLKSHLQVVGDTTLLMGPLLVKVMFTVPFSRDPY